MYQDADANGGQINRFLIAFLQRDFLAFSLERFQEFGIFPGAGFRFLQLKSL